MLKAFFLTLSLKFEQLGMHKKSLPEKGRKRPLEAISTLHVEICIDGYTSL